MPRLEQLRPEARFVVDGRAGTLLYASESRARVRWERTESDRAYEDNIAPGTEVEEVEEMFTLKDLQVESAEWSAHNFPANERVDPLLGVVEEVGELCHAFLKAKQKIRGTAQEHRAKMIDAVGDIVIFLADFCVRNDIDLHDAVELTWAQVKLRDWKKDPKTGGMAA